MDIVKKGGIVILKEYIPLFKSNLAQQNKSEHTITTYTRAIIKYCDWFEVIFDKPVTKLILENLLLYRAHLQQEKNQRNEPLSAKTINTHFNGLASFNQFLIEMGVMETRVVEKHLYMKVQRLHISPVKFNAPEIQQFFQSILEDETISKEDQYRNFALAKLLALTGCRISEALALTLDDIHLNEREITIRSGKGEKQRTLLVNDQLHRILAKYIREHRKKYRLAIFSRNLFMTNRSDSLSRKTVNKMFTKYSKLANFKKNLSPHDFRHYFCSMCMQNGMAMNEVASLAGHASIQTTAIYTNVSREKMFDKLNEIN